MRAVCAALAFLVGLGVLVPASAGANSKVIEQIGTKNQRAMENYDLLELEEAKRLLNEAVGLAKKHGVRHKVVARTYLNLAIVYFSGFQDVESARIALIDAVQLDPAIEVDPAYRTSELAKLVAETKREFAGTATTGAADAGAAPADCDSVVGIEHTLVEKAQAGEPRPIRALVSAELGAERVSLYYRGAGQGEFSEVRMESSGGCQYAGSIPASAIGEGSLHYYLAAVNGAGKTVASRGSSASPNVIEVVETGASLGLGDEENPLGGGGVDEEVTAEGEVESGAGGESIYMLVPIGTGGGYVTGATEQMQNDVGCCFAPALLNLSPELGYFFSPALSVAAAFRMGFPVGANLPGHATGAPSGMVRLRYGLGQDLDGLQLVGSAGGGILRHTVKLSNAPSGMDTDTVASGPFLLGGGLAYWKKLGGPMRLVAELHTLVGLPLGVEELGSCPGSGCVRPNYALHFDLNLGVLFSF